MSYLPILICLSAFSQPDGLKPAYLVDGPPIRAKLVAIDQEWNVTLDTDKKRVTVKADEFIEWGEHRDREGKPLVILADGGIVASDVLSITRNHVALSPTLWQPVKIPLEHVRGIIFRPPIDLLKRDRLVLGIQSSQGGQDQLLLKNGDQLAGILVDSKDDEPDVFQLETRNGNLPIPRVNATAITFNPALVDTPRPSDLHARVGFRDGSLLVVDQIVAHDEQLQVDLPVGVKLKTFPDRLNRLWSDFKSVSLANPRVTYLSDVRPVDGSYRHVPYLDLKWPFRTDRNVLGGRLRSSGNVYAKGLGMHSTSVVMYDLNEEFQRFDSLLSIDELAGERGSVTFSVHIYEGTTRRPAFKSKTIYGGGKPQRLSVDVSKARRMILVVEFADHGDQWDHANWLSARLIR